MDDFSSTSQSNIPPVTNAAPSDLQSLSSRIESLSQAVVNCFSALTTQTTQQEKLKEQVINQEKIISSLMMGYSEVVVIVEVLMIKLTAKYSDEEKAQLLKDLNEIREQMQQVIQGAVKETDEGFPGLAAAFERLGAQVSEEGPNSSE